MPFLLLGRAPVYKSTPPIGWSAFIYWGRAIRYYSHCPKAIQPASSSVFTRASFSRYSWGFISLRVALIAASIPHAMECPLYTLLHFFFEDKP